MAPKRRASLSQELPDEDDEPAGKPISKDGPALELDLSPKQNKLRTDLEMWVMDEVPALFGVDDSDELAEELQEDSQADRITELIAEKDAGAQRQAVAVLSRLPRRGLCSLLLLCLTVPGQF
eukprot:TRINITY_DN5622_c0_g1_i4.p1 TRINITY_DN5622_c0_g1~~TRINITY_DN5622_c0_g1_i4.p1  ORF type:complete len:122 (-),score=29.85 TRINITY_DN5622_c0_g1_i4:7-372(-)